MFVVVVVVVVADVTVEVIVNTLIRSLRAAMSLDRAASGLSLLPARPSSLPSPSMS